MTRHEPGQHLIPFLYTSTTDFRGVENGKQNIRAMAYINRDEARVLIGVLEQPLSRRHELGEKLANHLDVMQAQGKLGPDFGVPLYLMKDGIVVEATKPIYFRVCLVLLHFLAERTGHVVETALNQLRAFVAGQDIPAINPYASIAYQKPVKLHNV